jgi:ankyrin repeat protein
MTVRSVPESPLQTAASHRDLNRVRELVADGADPNLPGPLGHTALHTAAARDEPQIAEALIDAGAHVVPQLCPLILSFLAARRFTYEG